MWFLISSRYFYIQTNFQWGILVMEVIIGRFFHKTLFTDFQRSWNARDKNTGVRVFVRELRLNRLFVTTQHRKVLVQFNISLSISVDVCFVLITIPSLFTSTGIYSSNIKSICLYCFPWYRWEIQKIPSFNGPRLSLLR